MKGIQIITDKNHQMTEVEIFPALYVSGGATFDFSKTAVVEDFTGFGVAITGSSCYQLSMMEPDERKEFLKQIYSKEGLGLSVGRLSIASSDYSAELYSYDDVPFDMELKHFSIERDEKYIIPMIKEILEVNPDIYLFASPWSPPGWMKTGGNMCGGYMRREFIDCYADYIVKFIKAYAMKGIKISALTPQNEPYTSQNGLMPACIWHPEIAAEFVKILRRKLTDNGLSVEIWIHDHNFIDSKEVLWTLKNCDKLSESCDGVAFHYYSGTIEETNIIKKEFPKLNLHFTEGGPRLYDNYDTDWCKWGIMISKVLANGYKSFTGWNLMLNEMGGPNIGPFFCGGLATRNSASGELTYSGQYKAFKHIAPYINKNSKIYALSADNMYNQSMFNYPKQKAATTGFAIDNNDGKTVIVLVNPGEGKCQAQFEVNGSSWYAELPAGSISTIII